MQDPYLHIEDYVKGNLSEKDRLWFESAMSTDEQLRQSVEDFGLVDLIGEALIEEEIAGIVGEELARSEKGNVESEKEKVESEKGEVEKHRVGTKSKLWVLKWVVAAGVVLFLGWWITKERPVDKKHRELMAQYVYPENRGTRSLSTANTKLDSAIYLFDLRKMNESEKLFLEILAQDSTHQDANFYMAHISFLRKDREKCILYLEKDSIGLSLPIYRLCN